MSERDELRRELAEWSRAAAKLFHDLEERLNERDNSSVSATRRHCGTPGCDGTCGFPVGGPAR